MLPRLYPILDTGRSLRPVEQAKAMLDGGAQILQIRHKGLWTRELLSDVEAIAKLSPLLIINDRADIARILGAGVHVGQTDLPPADARPIVGDAVLGFSTHNREQFETASKEPIDYVALGPIFDTSTKLNPDPIVGLDTLRALHTLTPRPLVAIGGITRQNAWSVIEAGADSLAVISDLYPEELTAHNLRRRIEEWNKLLQQN